MATTLLSRCNGKSDCTDRSEVMNEIVGITVTTAESPVIAPLAAVVGACASATMEAMSKTVGPINCHYNILQNIQL